MEDTGPNAEPILASIGPVLRRHLALAPDIDRAHDVFEFAAEKHVTCQLDSTPTARGAGVHFT